MNKCICTKHFTAVLCRAIVYDQKSDRYLKSRFVWRVVDNKTGCQVDELSCALLRDSVRIRLNELESSIYTEAEGVFYV